MAKVTATQRWILEYLTGKGWTPPTKIGNSYREGYGSPWASPKCLKLVEMGELERDRTGRYRHSDPLKQRGNHL